MANSSNKPAVIFGHNVGRAEEDLNIQQDLGRRRFVPVAFRVGTHKNEAGTNTSTLKLLIWATRKGLGNKMTLDGFLPYFAEYWNETNNGTRAPSWSSHRNLHELWRLWRRNPKTLVSDVFELYGSAFAPKESATTGPSSRIHKQNSSCVEINHGYWVYRSSCHVQIDFNPLTRGFSFFMRNISI
ncbi:MAG: hypothetical protein HHAS10_01280 [Candidatus Altimarinota bacterium]